MMSRNRIAISIMVCFVCILHGNEAATTDSKVCQSDHCHKTATRMEALMNKDADPCENFHDFACGKFFKETTLGPSENAVGSFFDLIKSDKIAFKALLESPVDDTDPNSFELKMKTLYKSCKNLDAINLGLRGYKRSFKKEWPTLKSKWNMMSYDLQSLVDKYLKNFSEVLFQFSIEILYPENSAEGKYRLQISEPNLVLGKYDFGTKTENVEAFKKYYLDLAKYFGAHAKTAETDGQKIVDFLKSLSEYMVSSSDRWDPKVTTNPTTLGQMNVRYPYLDWVQAAKAMMDDMNVGIDPNDKVNIVYPKYLEGLDVLLKKTEPRTIQNLFAFSHAVETVKDANKEMRELWFSFKKNTKKPRDEHCIHLIDSLYNEGMAKLLSKSRYSTKAKTFMDQMIKNIKQAFIESFKSAEWMGQETKKKALLKVQKMSSKIGIRSDKFTTQDIDEFYKKFNVRKNKFIADMLQNRKQQKVNNMKFLNQPIKDWRWLTSMTVVNAFYFPTLNQIVFPLGIMQPPFFNQDDPSYNNYGAIGYFIGHEIGHGFDTSGHQYDEVGRPFNWWTPKDKDNFKTKAKCFIDQYSKLHVKQVNMMVNGSRSSTENMADNMGISQAYRAYQTYLQTNNPSELPLPKLGLSKDQLFFLSAAQTWCLKRTDDSLKRRLTNTRYAADESRTIGMMQNSRDFAKAFQCKSGDFMNPDTKCKLM